MLNIQAKSLAMLPIMRKTLIMKEKKFSNAADDDSDTEEKLPIVQRIEQFVKFKKQYGKFSVLKFQEAIDVSGSYVKNIRKSISDDVVLKIEEQFPELNIDWLKFGRGEMIKRTNSNASSSDMDINESEISEEVRARPIPVYDMDVFAGKTSLVNTTDYEYIIGWARIPGFEDCIASLRARGDSMHPVVKNNDQVLIMPAVNKKIIDWGSMYVVVFGGEMPPHPKIKYVRKGPDKNTVILRSHNEKYEDMEVSLDDIKSLHPARAGVIEF